MIYGNSILRQKHGLGLVEVLLPHLELMAPRLITQDLE